MSNTLGSLQLSSLTLEELNRVMRLLQDRIDTAYGLRGVHTISNRLRVAAPVDIGDVVVNPVGSSTLPADLAYKSIAGTITGLWTFSRGAAVPFAVAAGALKVTNLDADLVDGLNSTAFLILTGQAGGQTANGGVAASENLVLKSTAHATKGKVAITDLSPFKWEDANGTVIHQFGA
jgi:hypothetical protein